QELNCLPLAGNATHNEGPGFEILREDTPGNEILTEELIAVFAHREPHHQLVMRKLYMGTDIHRLPQYADRASIRNRDDPVVINLGDGPGIADGRSSLANLNNEIIWPFNRDCYATAIIDLIVQVNPRTAIREACACQ